MLLHLILKIVFNLNLNLKSYIELIKCNKIINFLIDKKQFRNFYKIEKEYCQSYVNIIDRRYIYNYQTIINNYKFKELYLIYNTFGIVTYLLNAIVINHNFNNNTVKVKIFSIQYKPEKQYCYYKYYKLDDVNDIYAFLKNIENRIYEKYCNIELNNKPIKKEYKLNMPKNELYKEDLDKPKNHSLIIQQGYNMPYLIDKKNKKIKRNKKFINYFEDEI